MGMSQSGGHLLAFRGIVAFHYTQPVTHNFFRELGLKFIRQTVRTGILFVCESSFLQGNGDDDVGDGRILRCEARRWAFELALFVKVVVRRFSLVATSPPG